ncbi:MAG TPA: hypothetical protein VFS01_15195, partial [Rhizomicrobium sp.]|nr:hypothetical protein [Rhizomicrobium sp.]
SGPSRFTGHWDSSFLTSLAAVSTEKGEVQFRVFAEEFTAEWNRLQAEASAGLTARRQELERVERQLARLVDALAEGAPVGAVKARMLELERKRGFRARLGRA